MRVVVNKTGIVDGAGRAVSLDAAKQHCDVTHDDDDVLILGLIDAATEYLANLTNSPVTQANFELLLNCWRDNIELPRWPLVSLTSVEHIPADADPLEFAALENAFETIQRDRVPSVLSVFPDVSLPALTTKRALPIRIRWVAGYAAGNVPPGMQHAIKLLIKHWYDERNPEVIGTISSAIGRSLDSLIWQYKPGNVSGQTPGISH